jgi:amidase
MGRAKDLLGVGRSLATGAVLGVTHRSARRLRALDSPAFAAELGDPDASRAEAVDALTRAASLSGLQSAMASGDLTAEELTRHLLARVLATDPALDAVLELNPGVLGEARHADERRRAGDRSPLLGVPVTVKDNIESVAPLRTTAGAEILSEHVATGDAPVVTALRAAGAVVLGKANLSELAGAVVRTPGFSALGGQTRNPYGRSFSPAGSSSGSAVSVAAGLAPLSVGTETSGSLLAPAALCGVVGMKPSRGVVDQAGIIPLVRHQDSAGPLAPTVADAAALLQVLSNGRIDADLSAAALHGVRVGVLREAILGQRSAMEDTRDNVEILARIDRGLAASGAAVATADVVTERALAEYDAAFLTVVLGGLTHDTVGYLAASGAPVETLADLHTYNLQRPARRMPKGQFFASLALARDISRDRYETAAMQARASAERILDATFAAARAEVLVSITNLHSSLYATAGYPAITVPLGLRAGGMPTGVTFISRLGTDSTLLGRAHAFEAATRLRQPPARLG